MPVKVLARDANELRVRFIGESHTSLQILRERLNNDKGVDYANYFPGHPDLDEPEFFIRTNKKIDPADLLMKLLGDIQGDFGKLKI
ncbi:MAG: RpoL/Rpb11 RNA polymerase subunit family protein [Candidatus Poseidoniales archaeon]|jgi:DNA-directed RNA polymerase subunit L|tara:strand:- start:2050 stop:2307 length:258 start_codon:yes stop_codon:yes gene_type:complete